MRLQLLAFYLKGMDERVVLYGFPSPEYRLVFYNERSNKILGQIHNWP